MQRHRTKPHEADGDPVALSRHTANAQAAVGIQPCA
jgi:hypothetical protein